MSEEQIYLAEKENEEIDTNAINATEQDHDFPITQEWEEIDNE